MQRVAFCLVMSAAMGVSGCDKKPKDTGASSAPSVSATAATSPAPAASVARKRSKMPPEARRNSAPVGIDESALKLGDKAPELSNVPSTKGAWSRGDRVTALVFYRGHW